MLIDELDVAARVAPGLVDALSSKAMMDLETAGPDVVAAAFREHGAPGFLIPCELGGRGGTLLDMAHVIRVVGARWPSLAIVMTMHHHLVAAFARGSVRLRACGAFVRRIAEERALVASA